MLFTPIHCILRVQVPIFAKVRFNSLVRNELNRRITQQCNHIIQSRSKMSASIANGSREIPRRKLVIDTDAGIDDAQAIFLALSRDDVDVVAITTVHGNTDADQVARNVLRVLEAADRLDIPVYKGAQKSLVGEEIRAPHYHGLDGLGDAPDPNAPSDELIKEGFAPNTLVSLANQYKGELELVCLAPLTNIAMALRTDPAIGSKIKHCYVMGGNYEGKGNMGPCAEFNFRSDPEAAYIVLNELGCEITMACWELCLKYGFSWDEHSELRSKKSKKCQFMKTIEKKPVRKCHDLKWPTYLPADELCMAIALNGDIVMSSFRRFVTVERSGEFARGLLVIDYENYFKKLENAIVITSLDRVAYKQMLLDIY